jgi:WD40 repeat protein
MADKPRVFISYARQDGEEFATALRQRLEREESEISLWQDRARMEGGIGWWQQITAALDAVEFLVLVMTPTAMQSAVARKEWRYARQRGVCVYPVKGVPDDALDYAKLPNWMSKAHFFDLNREWETFVHHLKSPCHAARVPFMAPDLPDGFVERPAVIEALLSQVLDNNRENPVAITTALRGAGGLGKTTLAAAICHRDEIVTAFNDGILWVTIGQKPNLQEGVAKLYAALTGSRPGFIDEEDAAFHLSEVLQDKSCLIVIDDVWDLAHLEPFMRGGSGCTRLITTRHFEVAVEARCIEVNEMTLAEAVSMLGGRLPVLPGEFASLRALAHRLGEWPLLLELANAALRRRVARHDTVQGALKYLNRQLDEQGVVAFDQRNASSRHQALTRTIDLSLNELDPRERERYYQLAIFPEDATVPLGATALLWECELAEAEDIVQQFDDLSLIKFSLQNGTLQLHDVMRSYVGMHLTAPAALHAKLVVAWGDVNRLSDPYAWRWFAYHLVEAGWHDRLRSLLLRFEWLQAKLDATNVTALISDFAFLPNDNSLKTVHGAIRLAAHVLARDKTQLAAQLLGRLSETDSPEIATLRAQASGWRGAAWMRPLEPSLTEPGGPLLFTFTGHDGAARTLAVTADGRRAVSGSDDLTVRVWDLERGTQLHCLRGHTDWIRAVAVSSDGRWAISTGDDQTMRIWDLESGTLSRMIDKLGDWPKALAVTPDAGYVLVAGDAQNIQLRMTENAKTVRVLKGHRGVVTAIVTTPDGKQAISASDDRTLKVWALDTGAELRTLRGHTARVVALAMARDGRSVVSASRDDTLRLWSLDELYGSEAGTGRVITSEAHAARSIALTPDGQSVIAGSDDGSIKIWNVDTGAHAQTLEGHTDWINGVATTPDAQRVVSASDDHTLKVWDLRSAEHRGERKGHADRVRAVTSSTNGRFAVSTSDDQKMRVWNLIDRTEILTCRGRSHWPVALCYERGIIVSAAGDATLELLDFHTGAVKRVLSGHTDRIRAVIATADGRQIVSASDDRTIRVWDFDTGNIRCVTNTQRHWTRALASTPDGNSLISGSDDRTLKVWDLRSGTELRTLRRHDARINSVAVSQDGRWVFSGSDDHLVKVWDLASGTEVMALKAHEAKVNAVAMGLDGKHLYSACDDFTLRAWELPSGKLLATYTGDSPMLACASGQDRIVIVGDHTGRLHFLHLECTDELRPVGLNG